MSTMTFLTLKQELGSRLRMDQTQSNENTLLGRWLNQSQQEIWSRNDWAWAADREIVQTVIDIKAGTVAVSSGATTVTGTSTAFASADVGKYIQFSSNNDWYKITAVASGTSLTIEKAYTGTSDLSGGTYTIRKLFYSVSSSVEKLLTVRQTIGPGFLKMVHFSKFDRALPNPTSTGNPEVLVVFGYDSSNNWQFTPYPFPSAVMNLEVRFKKKATDMSADGDVSLIPEKWHSTVLLDGGLYRGLEHVRTDYNDKRAEIKKNQFEDGVAQMMADANPDSEYFPVLMNRDSRITPVGPRFPANFGVE